MIELTKPEKRAVHLLLAQAHEAELAAALVDVEHAIRQWRSGQLLPSQVQERVHQFYKQSQETFKAYNYSDPMVALARALVLKLITEDQIPQSLRARALSLEEIIKE